MANSGLSKPMNLSPELQDIIGPGPMPRTEVTKALWVYIKANNLQDPQDKRNGLQGKIADYKEDSLYLETDSETISIPAEIILKAQLLF